MAAMTRKLLPEIERTTLLGFLLGVATALFTYGLPFVLGTSTFWDYPPTDWSSHVVGYRAYVLDGWHFPIFFTSTLEAPRGLNLLYMDALPIVALPAKLLAPLGPHLPSALRALWMNPFGAWVALSYGLQGAYGARLMRELSGRSTAAELSGSVLAIATPIFVLRFLHVALASHFFLLAALLLYVQCARGLARRPALARWTALFAALALVHPYLFAMCAGMFAATLATMALGGRLRDAIAIGASAVAVVLAIVLVSGFHGAEVSNGGMWGYGYKSTDLASFVTPQWATFFPYAHANRIDMTRSEAAEGWAYLGAGVLVAIAMALLRAPRAALAAARRHWVFVLALALMSAFAISHRITLGSRVLVELPLPGILGWPARQFRSCGRFVWPAVYAGSFYVLALLVRITRGTHLAPAVPLVAGLQLVDALAALLYVGAYTSRGEARFLEWDTMKPIVLDHAGVTFAPSFECVVWDRPIVAFEQLEVEYMAAARGGALSSVRSSRPLRDCAREPFEAARAPVAPDQLYLGFSPQAPAAGALHFERAGVRCGAFRSGYACSTRFAAGLPRGLAPFSPDVDYALGERIELGQAKSGRYLGVGWSWPEVSHRWTDGSAAFVYLRVAEGVPRGARLAFRAAGVELDRMWAAGVVNGVEVGVIELGHDPRDFALSLPDSLAGERLVEIELRPSMVRRPPSDSPDPRALGLAVQELTLE
jgi:hypothetical protein